MGGEKLFGRGKSRIISTFLDNRNVEICFREVCRLSKLTEPTVFSHLKSLTEVGFLKVRNEKNQKLYSVNAEHPIFHKIEVLFAN